MFELCQSYVAFIMPLFFEHPFARATDSSTAERHTRPVRYFVCNCAYNRGGAKSWIQIALIHPFILRLVLLLLTSVSRPHLERACSAHQRDIISKPLFCATYHAKSNWSNCARIANVCRMREVCEQNRVGRNNCEL